MSCHCDTSALVKWYARETDSRVYADYLDKHVPLHVNELVLVEFHHAMNKKLRRKDITLLEYEQACTRLEQDRRALTIKLHPLSSRIFQQAVGLLKRYAMKPLLTQDAIHVAFLIETPGVVTSYVTDDHVLAEFVQDLGLTVVRFS